MLILGWITALLTLVPITMFFTMAAWLIGTFRGASNRVRMNATGLVSGKYRRWLLWFTAGALGMVIAGTAASGTSVGHVLLGALALPLFALSQYEAFWLGYLIGDKVYARRQLGVPSHASVAGLAFASESGRADPLPLVTAID